MVECGCFLGGMSTKLSLVCKQTQRKLYILDTFEGLPWSEYAIANKNCLDKGVKNGIKYFNQGAMKGNFDVVINNLQKFGSFESCVLIKGLVSETFKNLDINPICVFIDIDLTQAARDCIKYFWNRLPQNHYLFSHEMWFDSYVESITNKKWWLNNINSQVPILNIFIESNDLGCFIKKKSYKILS